MMTVKKYAMQITAAQTVKLPENAKVLSVMEQHEGIVLFALIDSDRAATEPYTVIILGSEYEAPDLTGYRFLGTCGIHHGLQTVHVFIREEAFADGTT